MGRIHIWYSETTSDVLVALYKMREVFNYSLIACWLCSLFLRLFKDHVKLTIVRCEFSRTCMKNNSDTGVLGVFLPWVEENYLGAHQGCACGFFVVLQLHDLASSGFPNSSHLNFSLNLGVSKSSFWLQSESFRSFLRRTWGSDAIDIFCSSVHAFQLKVGSPISFGLSSHTSSSMQKVGRVSTTPETRTNSNAFFLGTFPTLGFWILCRTLYLGSSTQLSVPLCFPITVSPMCAPYALIKCSW